MLLRLRNYIDSLLNRSLSNRGATMSFRMQGTQTLTTERLIIRRFEPDDAEMMLKNWASDPRVTQYMSWEPYSHVSAARAYIADCIRQYEKHDYFNWAIELQGEVIGAISGHTVDPYLHAVELGYCLGYDYWSQGIMTEVVVAVIDYFLSTGFNRVSARHHPDNPASGRVMQKAGMTYEGLIRQGGVNAKMGFYDLQQYAIVASDRKKLN